VRNIFVSLRFLKKAKFFKALVNSRDVQGQNKHNSKNQKKSLHRELYGYYCFGLHKRMNSSKHLVII
jgi:hypothetical protein